MAKFTTRVELHDADEDDYETLHDAMAKEGFSRTIKNEAGKEYHLPTAEYNRSAEISLDDVLVAAKRAANKTLKRFSVLITKSEGRRWEGLKKVE